MESSFSVDRTFIHALVATLQPFDGHRQFGRSAPPIWTFVSSTALSWISRILSVSYLSAGFSCTNTGPTALFLSSVRQFEQVFGPFLLLSDVNSVI